MIRINDKWAIAVDECNYSPVRIGVSQKGEETVKRIGYYTSIEGALGRVANEMSREELMKSDVNLKEAIAVINECYAELMRSWTTQHRGRSVSE